MRWCLFVILICTSLMIRWASLVAHLVKNLPTVWETQVQSLGWEDRLKKGKATHSSILAWRIAWTVYGVSKSQTGLSNFHFHLSLFSCIWWPFTFSLQKCLFDPQSIFKLSYLFCCWIIWVLYIFCILTPYQM